MTIHITDDVQVRKDTNHWTLITWRTGENNDGEPTRTSRNRYYPTLQHACLRALDHMTEGEDTRRVIQSINEAREAIVAAVAASPHR